MLKYKCDQDIPALVKPYTVERLTKIEKKLIKHLKSHFDEHTYYKRWTLVWAVALPVTWIGLFAMQTPYAVLPNFFSLLMFAYYKLKHDALHVHVDPIVLKLDLLGPTIDFARINEEIQKSIKEAEDAQAKPAAPQGK